MTELVGHFPLGPEHGRLLIHTRREGLAARAGHDLTIEVTRWAAALDIPADDPEQATVTARIQLNSLAVREGAGGALPLSSTDKHKIETNILRILGHDTATYDSTKVTAGTNPGVLTVNGVLTIHGRPAPVRLDISELSPGRYLATGIVTQSAHGIRPYSGMFGALKLRDEVGIEIEVALDDLDR